MQNIEVEKANYVNLIKYMPVTKVSFEEKERVFMAICKKKKLDFDEVIDSETDYMKIWGEVEEYFIKKLKPRHSWYDGSATNYI